MKIQSNFAVLDVKGRTRHSLSKHFQARPLLGKCPVDLRIPVTITGYLEGQHSRDDGTSIEFSMVVENVQCK